MHANIANFLIKHIDGASLYPDYSGRFMFGSTTHAVCLDDPVMCARLQVMKACVDNQYELTRILVNMDRTTLDGFKYDDFGKGSIVY